MIHKDQGRLNSLTKYPSIETYHAMDGKGVLLEQCIHLPQDAPIRVTEKIDGTNARIIFFPAEMDYFIGSREELLHARGDRVINPAMSIVPTLIPWADHMLSILACHYGNGEMFGVYGEVYGGNVSKASRQYTDKRTLGFRVFDTLHMQAEYVYTMMSKSRETIAAWRDNGGQPFCSYDQTFIKYKDMLGYETVPIQDAEHPPTDIEGTLEWLRWIAPRTAVHLDGGDGEAEGVVIRTDDRSIIAKIRFEDYERTLRKAGKL